MTASQWDQLPEASFEIKERALDEAPVGITISDTSHPDNPLVYVNDQFVRMTGYSKEFALGRNCRFLQGEETAEEPVARMARAVEKREPLTVEVRNYRKNGEQFWNEVTIAPLRNEAGEVTHFVGFQADITDRKGAELAVERERKNLSKLIERIDGLLESVSQELVSSVNRTEVEDAVCSCITETTPYDIAWIGRVDITGDHLESTGLSSTRPDVSELRIDLADAPDLRSAIDGDELRVLPEETVGMDDASGPGEVAVVPLRYGNTAYGALLVHADTMGTFNEREAAVLESLGRMIATAFNAHESKRILTTDSVVEIEFSVRDRAFFFVDLSARTGSTLEYAGSVYREGVPITFFTTDGDPETVAEMASESPEITEAIVMGDGKGSTLLEFHLGTESTVTELAERGAKTRSITATDGEGRIEIELPADADARSVVERITDSYPNTELVRYQERERPPTTKREFIADLEERLTDQQFTALRRAFLGGYYDRKRGTNGDELAESMGISRPTFHQHLRAAERKLVAEFFDR